MVCAVIYYQTGFKMMTPMDSLDNNNKGVENNGGVYDKTVISSQTGGPLDVAFIQINDNSVTSSPVPAAVNGDATQDVDGGGDGFPLKRRGIRKAVKHIHRRAWSNLALSALRNLLSWMCIISLVVMISQANVMHTWSHHQVAAIVVVFSVGLLGLGFHIFRSYLDLTFKYPTVVGKLLRDALSREEFIRLIQNREMSPPEVAVEITLKSGAMSYEDPNHWTRTQSRKTRKELSYRGWADQSPGVGSFQWPDGKSAWVAIGKDFRCIDSVTLSSLESDVAEFRRDSGYDANKYFMTLEYILQWKESDSSDDAEMFLVFEDVRPGFYSMELYKACTLVAIDALYRAIFHIATRNLKDYYIVKFLER